jgi:hypothetical protein
VGELRSHCPAVDAMSRTAEQFYGGAEPSVKVLANKHHFDVMLSEWEHGELDVFVFWSYSQQGFVRCEPDKHALVLG